MVIWSYQVETDYYKYMNGKGSKPRPYNIKKYHDNYNDIDWHHGDERPEYNFSKELGEVPLDRPGLYPIRVHKKKEKNGNNTK